MFQKLDTLNEGEQPYFDSLADPARSELVIALGEFLDSPDSPDPIIANLADATAKTFDANQILSMRTTMTGMRETRILEPKRLLATLIRYSEL